MAGQDMVDPIEWRYSSIRLCKCHFLSTTGRLPVAHAPRIQTNRCKRKSRSWYTTHEPPHHKPKPPISVIMKLPPACGDEMCTYSYLPGIYDGYCSGTWSISIRAAIMKTVEKKAQSCAKRRFKILISSLSPQSEPRPDPQPTRAQFMRPNLPFQPITTRSRIDFERARC